ncbi:MAG: hypothetical protein Tsb0034_17720 [Ekhidna sp.]
MNTVAKFKVLLGLAQADGQFDSTEKAFIKELAASEGLSLFELKGLLKKSDKIGNLIQELNYDDKIDILAYLIKLMKVDGKVLLSEIKYCERVAEIFGFEKKSIGFLSGTLDSNTQINPNLGRIKYRMRKYITQAA